MTQMHIVNIVLGALFLVTILRGYLDSRAASFIKWWERPAKFLCYIAAFSAIATGLGIFHRFNQWQEWWGLVGLLLAWMTFVSAFCALSAVLESVGDIRYRVGEPRPPYWDNGLG